MRRISSAVFIAGLSLLVHASCGARTDLGDGAAPTRKLTDDDYARAAAVIAACPTISPDANSTEINLEAMIHGSSYDATMIACLAHHGGGCEAVGACTSISITPGPDCAPHCDGTRAVSCDGGWVSSVDCAAMPDQACEGTTCLVTNATGCGGETSFCDANRPAFCVGQEETLSSTCSLGTTCSTTATSPSGTTTAACIGPGLACVPTLADLGPGGEGNGLRCDDADTLVRCENGFEATSACDEAGAGFGCHTLGGTSYCGTAEDCDPTSFVASCDGNSLLVCSGGAMREVDCVALGFVGCAGSNCAALPTN